MAKAIIIVGRPRSGKTTSAKKLLSSISLKKEIYDVNNEYNTGKPFPDMEDFLNDSLSKTETCFIFEEATIFFSNKGDERRLKTLLVRKRHTKNIIILCFHSLRSVPTYVFDLIDFYILHKTNDNTGLIDKKFSGNYTLLNDFKKVNEATDEHFRIVRKLA
jgi:hypothetical protein